GSDPLRGTFIMRAAGGVDVVIAGEPLAGGRVNPAFELELFTLADNFVLDREFAVLNEIFRSPRDFDRVFSGRQVHAFPISPVDLVVEEEIGSEPPRRVRIN